MPQRRRVFDEKYGTAKMEQGKPTSRVPPPMSGPPVPLSLSPQQAQGQEQGTVLTTGQADAPLPPGIEEMLQQLFAKFGGSRG